MLFRSIHGFYYDGNSFTTLDDPNAINYANGDYTFAYGVNNDGSIVGTYGHQGKNKAFILNSGIYTDIIHTSTTLDTQAYGLNDVGQIVGEYSGSLDCHSLCGYVLKGGVFTNIVDDITTTANGINDLGTIVGWSEHGSGSRGFIATPTPEPPPPPPTPEPATWAMMLVGFGGMGAAIRSRRKLALLSTD